MTVQRVFGPDGRMTFSHAETLNDAVAALDGKPGNIVVQGMVPLVGPLVLAHGQCIEGYGATVMCTRPDSSISLAARSVLSGFKLKGTGTGVGIVGKSKARWTVRDLHVESFTTGITLADSWIGAVVDCIVQSCDVGVSTSNITNAITIRGGEIVGCGTGMRVAGTNRIGLDGLTIEGCTTYGFHLAATTNIVTIRDCYFELNGTADVHVGANGRALSILTSQFLATPTSIQLDAGIGALVEGNFFQPNGTGAKALRIGRHSQRAVIGPNFYASGAFDPATDDAGTGTVLR